MSQRIDRRALFVRLGGALAALGGVGAAGCNNPGAFSCTETGLGAEDQQQRTTLEYVERCPLAAKQCTKCTQWVAPSGDGCGQCKVLKGPIHPYGSCKLFALKG